MSATIVEAANPVYHVTPSFKSFVGEALDPPGLALRTRAGMEGGPHRCRGDLTIIRSSNWNNNLVVGLGTKKSGGIALWDEWRTFDLATDLGRHA